MKLVLAAALLVALCLTPEATGARIRCSLDPRVAARFIVPPPPFRARVLAVERVPLPRGEPVGRGTAFKRLYLVTFLPTRGNVVLPTGRRVSQFAYVVRKTAAAPWCFLKGGSGP